MDICTQNELSLGLLDSLSSAHQQLTQTSCEPKENITRDHTSDSCSLSQIYDLHPPPPINRYYCSSTGIHSWSTCPPNAYSCTGPPINLDQITTPMPRLSPIQLNEIPFHIKAIRSKGYLLEYKRPETNAAEILYTEVSDSSDTISNKTYSLMEPTILLDESNCANLKTSEWVKYIKFVGWKRLKYGTLVQNHKYKKFKDWLENDTAFLTDAQLKRCRFYYGEMSDEMLTKNLSCIKENEVENALKHTLPQNAIERWTSQERFSVCLASGNTTILGQNSDCGKPSYDSIPIFRMAPNDYQAAESVEPNFVVVKLDNQVTGRIYGKVNEKRGDTHIKK